MKWLLGLLGGSYGIYIVGAVAALLLLVGGIAGVQTLRLNHAKADLQIAKDRADVAEARVKAAADAAAVVSHTTANDAATDKQTKDNRDGILRAPGALAPVDPGVDDAGRRAICMRHSARCTPSCVRLLGACPK